MMEAIIKTPKALIKELAEFISLEYDSTITPLDEICAAEKLPVYYDDYDDAFDGLLIYDSGFNIHINETRGNRIDSPRGRFTLGHELGHYFIDNHRIGLKSGLLQPHGSLSHMSSQHKIEREADYFASCLLMPEKRFVEDCFKRKFSFSLIEELAEKFGVSITACAIRFADIGTHPIMIVFCENNEVIWSWNSHDFRYKYLAEGKKKIPKDTLVAEYFEAGKGEKRTEQLWAADWFNCYNHEHENNRIYEHIIPYKNKALCLIWED